MMIIFFSLCLLNFFHRCLSFHSVRASLNTFKNFHSDTIRCKQIKIDYRTKQGIRLLVKDMDDEIYENEERALGDDDDTEIEDAMALETFMELSYNTNSLSVQAFMDWEDIQDVLARGFVDQETIKIVLKEVGVKSGFMNFVQFKDTVELVNQVNAALEHNSLDDEDDRDVLKNAVDGEDESWKDETAEADDDDSTVRWIEAQLNKMDRSD